MTEWLYDQINAGDGRRSAQFAQLSALNWMRALAFSITAEHGNSFETQWRSCTSHFASVKPRTAVPDAAELFEPLYASITFATSVISLAWSPSVESWRCAGAVIEWYYAVYHSMRAMLVATADKPPNTHASVASVINEQLRRFLPHPLNMRVAAVTATDCVPELPSHRAASERGGPSALTERFKGTTQHADEMLLSYLRGSVSYYKVEALSKLLRSPIFKKNKWTDFRTRDARASRDEFLRDLEYNFLHLAFRYRGKANYRDAVFLAYGSGRVLDARSFVRDLATCARFCGVCAAAYIYQRCGRELLVTFMKDVRRNFDGYDAFRGYLS